MFSIFSLPEFLDSEEKAFAEQLCNRYEKTIWYIANKILRRPDWANESTQDTVLKLMEKADILMVLPEDEVKAYVLTSARNNALNLIKRESKARQADIEKAEYLTVNSFDNPLLEAISLADTYRAVIDKIRKLPPKYKDVIILRYINEFNISEIAKILGISPENVRVRIHRGLDKLKQALGHEGGDV